MVLCAVLYPRGGAFNKLRSKQSFLENLLRDCLDEYNTLGPSARSKKDFIKTNIFHHLEACGYTFMVFEGEHPDQGKLVTPSENEACKKIFQKLRSMKKAAAGLGYKNGKRSTKKHVEESIVPDAIVPSAAAIVEVLSSSQFSRYSFIPVSDTDSVDFISSADICGNSDDDIRNFDMNLDQLKEIIWSQKQEIECGRRVIQRKNEVIEAMKNLLEAAVSKDQVVLTRIVSQCSTD